MVNDPNQASGHYQSTVAIYNQAKSAEEIQGRAASTEINALDPTLYALWADNTGTDLTGNGNTATLTSASVAGGPSEHVSVCNCLSATPINGPTCSSIGLSLDGNNDYADIDD